MEMNTSRRPYFLWDYDLSEVDIRNILDGENEADKLWIMARILESARFDDIWKYYSLADLRKFFPKLKLKKPVYQAWKYALEVWENNDESETSDQTTR